jgi:hypothetical protein
MMDLLLLKSEKFVSQLTEEYPTHRTIVNAIRLDGDTDLQ